MLLSSIKEASHSEPLTVAIKDRWGCPQGNFAAYGGWTYAIQNISVNRQPEETRYPFISSNMLEDITDSFILVLTPIVHRHRCQDATRGFVLEIMLSVGWLTSALICCVFCFSSTSHGSIQKSKQLKRKSESLYSLAEPLFDFVNLAFSQQSNWMLVTWCQLSRGQMKQRTTVVSRADEIAEAGAKAMSICQAIKWDYWKETTRFCHQDDQTQFAEHEDLQFTHHRRLNGDESWSRWIIGHWNAETGSCYSHESRHLNKPNFGLKIWVPKGHGLCLQSIIPIYQSVWYRRPARTDPDSVRLHFLTNAFRLFRSVISSPNSLFLSLARIKIVAQFSKTTMPSITTLIGSLIYSCKSLCSAFSKHSLWHIPRVYVFIESGVTWNATFWATFGSNNEAASFQTS